MKMKLKIKGIDCANCAAKLENQIQKIEGVENATLSFMTEKLIFECEEEKREEIIEKIKKVVKKEEPDAKVEEN